MTYRGWFNLGFADAFQDHEDIANSFSARDTVSMFKQCSSLVPNEMYRKQYGECAKWHWAFWLETFGNSEKYGSGNGMFHFYSEPQHYGWVDSYHLNFVCNPLKKTSHHPNFLINPLKGVGAGLFSRCRESWRTEKMFCEYWSKCTLWNMNCQNSWLCTHTVKIKIYH